MSDNSNTLLDVQALSVAFGGRKVVEEVSFTLSRGRTLGIVGESGSGKSVSTLALMGLLPRQAAVSGRALLANGHEATDLLALDEEALRSIRGKRIAMIFQEPMTSLNPVQRCGEQVLEMIGDNGRSHAENRKHVIDLFSEVLLPRPEKIFDSYPHEISGGQKQRVMIAMALANEPDILIADEPTTALDVTVQKTILELLRSLQQKRGTSIIFITHDLGVIAQIADDIMVMYRGHIVEQGPALQILHHPREPYTQGLLACRPPLDSRPYRLPTVEEFLEGGDSNGANGADVQDGANGVNGSNGQDEAHSDQIAHSTHLTQSPHSTHSPHPTQSPHPPLISVRDLSVTYTLKRSLFGKPLQTLKGVDGVSFDIFEGETLGLVGESGCGKSTLGRALLRLIDHSDGSIAYRGRPLDSLSRHQMRVLRPRLQIIFQDPYSSLNPRITIGDAIAEPLRVHRKLLTEKTESSNFQVASGHSVRENKVVSGHSVRDIGHSVRDLMEQVGLDPAWYNRYPHELSGGQRQRACIARALILQPELIICDESVSALDVSVQAQVLNLLNDLKRLHHYTYLFITHDLSVVKFLSDRRMVMQRGRIVESGRPDDLFAHPQTDYTRTLISAIPRRE